MILCDCNWKFLEIISICIIINIPCHPIWLGLIYFLQDSASHISAWLNTQRIENCSSHVQDRDISVREGIIQVDVEYSGTWKIKLSEWVRHCYHNQTSMTDKTGEWCPLPLNKSGTYTSAIEGGVIMCVFLYPPWSATTATIVSSNIEFPRKTAENYFGELIKQAVPWTTISSEEISCVLPAKLYTVDSSHYQMKFLLQPVHPKYQQHVCLFLWPFRKRKGFPNTIHDQLYLGSLYLRTVKRRSTL